MGGVHKESERGGHAAAELRELLASRFGYREFLPGQEEALHTAMQGRHLLLVMPTGSGKSLVYQLPALLGPGLTIVVSPLISLMKDQVDELTRRHIAATYINSSLSREEQVARLAACRMGAYHILYVAPERCRDPAFVKALGELDIARLAIDEAHCISEWGHDFRPDYRRLKEFRKHAGNPPLTALTATATARVQRDIVDSLGLRSDEVDVQVHGFDRPNLTLSVRPTFGDERKLAFLHEFLTSHGGCGIIYAGTRKTVERLAGELKRTEPTIVGYHAGMEAAERTSTQEAFIGGKARVVAATSAFGMGIDKRDVRFVIHYNYPGSVEQYYQEIGRAGRDGATSECVLLYASEDGDLRRFFIDMGYPDRERVKEVYERIVAMRENPVLLTYKEIGKLCDGYMSEGQVGSAVRLLDGAGVLRAYSAEARIAVTLERPYAELQPHLRGDIPKRIFEALSSSNDLETPGRFDVSLPALASNAELEPAQVRRALAALRDAGLIGYEPPFRGRGIEKVMGQQLPFARVPIDWERQRALRTIEEERLEAMEMFINIHTCRRAYILGYFGERGKPVCDTCDNCRGRETAASPGGVLERRAAIAEPVLLCMRCLRFPVGKARITEVVTGSRSQAVLERGLERNPAFGLAQRGQNEVREVIEELILAGYIERNRNAEYPVCILTPAGKKVATGITAAGLAPRGGATPKEAPARRRPAHPSSTGEIDAAVLQCVREMPFRVGAEKLAEVLTASKSEWIVHAGIAHLECYGTVNATKATVKKRVESMLKRKLLRRSFDFQYPVIELTDKGRAELADARNWL